MKKSLIEFNEVFVGLEGKADLGLGNEAQFCRDPNGAM